MPQINMMFIDTIILFFVLTTIDAQNTCTDRSVNCINIRNCAEILSILTGPLSEKALQFIRNSQCGFDGSDPKVCCNEQATLSTISQTISQSTPPTTPKPISQTTPPTIPKTISQTIPPITETTEVPEIDLGPPNVINHPNLRLLNHRMCGIIQPKSSLDVVFNNATFASLYQFPWMAIIAYDTGEPNPEFRCSGTVISSRYVLTAAHCVTSLPAGFRVISVRIGQHDISLHCEIDHIGRKICSEMYQDVAVESVHFHPEYNRERLQNDIALIRLNSSVDFNSRNAKPICLPFGTATNLEFREGVVTGWGPHSKTLLRARLPLVAYESCKNVYSPISKIWYKQLCAGGQRNIDSCLSDSGGPLQTSGIYMARSLRIIQYGIFSYGLRQCGTEGFPEVYTKVTYYMDWILDTMIE